MSGHAILHVMDDMNEGSRGASVLEQSSFSVSFLVAKRKWVVFRIRRAEKRANGIRTFGF